VLHHFARDVHNRHSLKLRTRALPLGEPRVRALIRHHLARSTRQTGTQALLDSQRLAGSASELVTIGCEAADSSTSPTLDHGLDTPSIRACSSFAAGVANQTHGTHPPPPFFELAIADD